MGNVNLIPDPEFDYFLTPDKGRLLTVSTDRNASVKDMVEALGIPHTDVGELICRNSPLPFSHIPVDRDVIHILPITPPLNVTIPSLLRPRPMDALRFIADVNVGKLARLLILMGFDTSFSNSYADQEVADIAVAQNRVILTRDTNLLKRKKVMFGRRVRASAPYDQLMEVLGLFGLTRGPFDFMSRCTECNDRLEPVDKDLILERLEPKTRLYFDQFTICPSCSQVYWKGSHHQGMITRFHELGLPVDLQGETCPE
ncbi:MAG: Mut7-C RNAse domain-containing protein [Pseudomonadota bacterium]